MADIQVTCSQCSATLKVSEYVDIEVLKCRACGGQMTKPAGAGESAKPSPVRLAAPKAQPEPPHQTLSNQESLDRNRRVRAFFPKRLNRPGRKRKSGSNEPKSVLRYWILFVILAGIATLVRWGGVIGDRETMETIIHGSLIFFGVLHVTMLLEAFREDIFQGVLCVFIPFYSVYFLLTQTDNFIIRALGAGMLAAFGYDLTLFVIEKAIWTYEFVEHWIMTVN